MDKHDCQDDSFAELITHNSRTIREIEDVVIDSEVVRRLDSASPEIVADLILSGERYFPDICKSRTFMSLEPKERVLLLAGMLGKVSTKNYVEDIDRMVRNSARVYSIMPSDIMDVVVQVSLALRGHGMSLTNFTRLYDSYFDKNGHRIQQERSVLREEDTQFPHGWIEDIWDKSDKDDGLDH